MDKYQETLASSQVNADDAVVAAEVKKIVEKAGQYANSDVYQFLFSSIDLTTLSTTDTQTSV
ncbi:MAG: deoxyribose-phosphate aldolase, partial [Muribaculaceae bacterium]|nr:deoxyribose-phosphate aldolase [Muribaculaceae bacterium]